MDKRIQVVTGCTSHQSILRCPPGEACAYPACIGQIPNVPEGKTWPRDAQGWRGVDEAGSVTRAQVRALSENPNG